MAHTSYDLFAAHHQRLINTLGDLSAQAGNDPARMPELLTCLWEQLIPHARAEEAVLYQRAATLAGGSALVFTMTRDHEKIVEQAQELSGLFAAHEDDALQDALRSLVELIYAHFHQEEDALIPLLHQHLAPKEFGRLIEETHRAERAGTPSDLKRFMDMDHQRVDRLPSDFSTLRDRDKKQAAAFAAGRERLLQHIVWEEDLLFPAFEDKTGMHDAGPTWVMRREHAQIKALLAQIAALLETGTKAGPDVVEQELIGAITVHNMKEETILYPMLNRSLSAQERRDLLEKMR